MPTLSSEAFVSAIASRPSPISVPELHQLIASTFAVPAVDIDGDVIEFAFSRLMLGYRTTDMDTNLSHLYDVLCVFERENASVKG